MFTSQDCKMNSQDVEVTVRDSYEWRFPEGGLLVAPSLCWADFYRSV